nr:hypothetical protein [Tanacetum cinerariifolium]
MRPFGCPVTILNTLDHLGKFQGKVDEGFLVGYSVCSKAFRVFNSRTRIVQETLHVNFMENKPNVAGSGPAWLDAQIRKQGDKTKNKDKGKSPVVTITGFKDLNAEFKECTNNSSNGVNAASSLVSTTGHNFINNTNDFSAAGPSNTAASPIVANSSSQDSSTSSNDSDMPNLEDLTHSDDADDVGVEADINKLESIILVSPIPTTRIHKDHLTSQIIGDLSLTTQTRSMARTVRDQGGLSQMFNKDFHTCKFACFLSQEEPKRVHQALKDPKGIGTKWVYRNKKDERGIVIRNKSRLIARGHTQEEGIDYEEVFAPVARIEAIRLFLAYASFMVFLVYQMDVKSAFLYGTIEEEVYVCQPPGFKDPENPDKVYKVVKALYGLHQAPRACQDKYVAEILKKFRLSEGKSASTLIDAEKPLLKESDGEDVDVHTYRTLIEAARTMLADSLLLILFQAEAVNTACCVQNRVLVTKPYNKTRYELLHGRTPSISFMRPFGCPVTILNTLDPLGKFERKVDEEFLVGYFVCSKAFRVFNSRTSIIQETLHVNFLENKPNVAGEEVDQQYVLFPMWSSDSINPQNNDGDATFDGKEHDFDAKKLDPTYGKSSFIDASQLPDDSDMPELEGITYSDDKDVVGAEADFNNLESSIP